MVDAIRTTLSIAALFGGVLFFLGGTVGLLRFRDVFSRLHAVTKADTVGLGLITLGLILRSGAPREMVLMAVIWVLAMASGAVSGQLYARFERERSNHKHHEEEERGREASGDRQSSGKGG